MTESNHRIEGIAASIDTANLDTDQIMPKQFLHGIDKAGLDRGLLWDLRFTGEGEVKEDFVLNRPEFAGVRVLVAGPNFGCGSSREHAVWGLQQFGIQAVIASAFGENFYSNAMNNRLLAVLLPEDHIQALLTEAGHGEKPLRIEVDLATMIVKTPGHSFPFVMSPRHRKMFIDGLDMIGASLEHKGDILAFASRHWLEQPWVKDVAARTTLRLDQQGGQP